MRQISIFLENKSSATLAKATKVIAEAGVNISAVSLADSADFGILRLIVDDTEKAAQLLKGQGYTISVNEVATIGMANKPGALSKVLELFSDNGLNLEYMYATVERTTAGPALVFRFEDPEKALKILKKARLKFLPEKKRR